MGCGSRRCRRRTWRWCGLATAFSERDLDALAELTDPNWVLTSRARLDSRRASTAVSRVSTSQQPPWKRFERSSFRGSSTRRTGRQDRRAASCQRKRPRQRPGMGTGSLRLCLGAPRQQVITSSTNTAPSPRSRGAAGVGDVAGEHRGRASLFRGVERRRQDAFVAVSTRTPSCGWLRIGPSRGRTSAGRRSCASSSSCARRGTGATRLNRSVTSSMSVIEFRGAHLAWRRQGPEAEVELTAVGRCARADPRRGLLPRLRGGARNPGAAGVGDVAGERGDRARVVDAFNRQDWDAWARYWHATRSGTEPRTSWERDTMVDSKHSPVFEELLEVAADGWNAEVDAIESVGPSCASIRARSVVVGRESGMPRGRALPSSRPEGGSAQPRPGLPHKPRGSRSRRGVGVGDVAGERGRLRRQLTPRPPGESRRCCSSFPKTWSCTRFRMRPRARWVHGDDGIREVMSGWNDSFEDFTVATGEIRDNGDNVVALGEISGIIRASDVPVRQRMGIIAWDFGAARSVNLASFLPGTGPRRRWAAGVGTGAHCGLFV